MYGTNTQVFYYFLLSVVQVNLPRTTGSLSAAATLFSAAEVPTSEPPVKQSAQATVSDQNQPLQKKKQKPEKKGILLDLCISLIIALILVSQKFYYLNIS